MTDQTSMDTIKIVHIAAEVVVLASITFYFNGQLKGLKSEIATLKAKIDEQNEASNKHLNNVYALLDKLNHSNSQQQQRPPQTPQQAQPNMGIRKRHTSVQDLPEPIKTRPSKHKVQSPEPELEDLDIELGEELQELEEEESELKEETYSEQSPLKKK